MSKPSPQELADFEKQCDAWFAENTVRDPGFMLPLTFMEVSTDQQFDFLRDWQRKVYEAGYFGMSWPTEYGGYGMHPEYQRIATRVMKSHDAPIMLNAIANGWTGPLLLDIGREEDKRRFIKPMLSAEEIWCQGFSEPEHGSDLGSAQTKAVRDGDEYVINGSKIWTSLGDRADYMILLARTSNDGPSKYAGLSFFLAPMKIPGVETRRLKKLTGEYGFTQCFFTEARIPASGLVGEEGQGWMVAMKTLEYERGAKVNPVGGYFVKEMDVMGVIDMARSAKRGGKPVLDDPVMRDRLVDYMIEIQALNLNNQRRRMAPLTSDRPMGLALMNKLARTELVRELTEFSLQFQGTRAGYYVGDENAVDDGYWHRSYLNSFSATIGGGTSQIQKNIIGEHVLGLPKGR
ncbi:MAG: acyl-CoA dehydrogenase [Sphingomonadales bacterium 35-56-22]|jgi:alkylation response protein AidB-like acyl-CoA dehydrogenase|uniref:acyl-CoA dehydrogenase family protein n=1 Tax=Sphingorhabdus sp. TaxID=1902408 RepID=UPI000BCB3519|nr:acyl-CoA dehydrogenase family protein [Sphingorhabdus sp.]OYY15979.1 MAG: acyl-CoA dehydrogenase [Sphingomonadales bacterium 35-56-22]OYY97552.1 MAG: acyl-CoA dehydrogenase [Sphingomonadales bacterium 28-56-43]OYZ61066.1 MAG: acyl-CoA dehydrogenase [Sphingomonadales bacterium 24-56-14]OZA82551.1 MAG: acyl-CoA dehydrogenase [Sphingomonadales bacterium 39-57-19]HQS12716.1 acyl-CoA dehydrogenase family protein [Sphingorhabdus sp.]